jgi:hypothetical protein
MTGRKEFRLPEATLTVEAENIMHVSRRPIAILAGIN